MQKHWWVIGIVVVAGLLWWGYTAQTAEPVSTAPVKVGALLLLSGDFTSYGESAKAAVEIAVERYNSNSRNTRKIEMIYEDTQADPKTAVSAYQKLVSVDNVDAILGPMLQVEMSAIAPLVKQNKMPIFSVSNPDKVLRGDLEGFTAVWPDPTLEAEQMAQFVYSQGTRSVAVLGTKDSWEAEVSDAFSKKFTALGGTVLHQELVQSDDSDVSAVITKALATKPEALFLGTYFRFTHFVKKARELGFTGQLYSIEIDTHLAEETKPHSNGMLFISPEFYTDEFVAAFEAKAGAKPTIPSGQVHDAMQILLSIVPESRDRDEVLSRMSALREFSGVSGDITFTDKHQAVFPLNIFKIENGEIMRAK